MSTNILYSKMFYPFSRCTAMRWYSYMGDSNTPYVPFQINYRLHNSTALVDGFKPMNPSVVPCSESVDVSEIVMKKIEILNHFLTGHSASMLVCRLCLFMSKATSTRANTPTFHHLGLWRLLDCYVVHLSRRQYDVCDGNRMVLKQRGRWVQGRIYKEVTVKRNINRAKQ